MFVRKNLNEDIKDSPILDRAFGFSTVLPVVFHFKPRVVDVSQENTFKMVFLKIFHDYLASKNIQKYK